MRRCLPACVRVCVSVSPSRCGLGRPAPEPRPPRRNDHRPSCALLRRPLQSTQLAAAGHGWRCSPTCNQRGRCNASPLAAHRRYCARASPRRAWQTRNSESRDGKRCTLAAKQRFNANEGTRSWPPDTSELSCMQSAGALGMVVVVMMEGAGGARVNAAVASQSQATSAAATDGQSHFSPTGAPSYQAHRIPQVAIGRRGRRRGETQKGGLGGREGETRSGWKAPKALALVPKHRQHFAAEHRSDAQSGPEAAPCRRAPPRGQSRCWPLGWPGAKLAHPRPCPRSFHAGNRSMGVHTHVCLAAHPCGA